MGNNMQVMKKKIDWTLVAGNALNPADIIYDQFIIFTR